MNRHWGRKIAEQPPADCSTASAITGAIYHSLARVGKNFAEAAIMWSEL
jgi:hypothetical protein